MSNWHRKYTKRHLSRKLSFHRNKNYTYKKNYNILKVVVIFFVVLLIYFNWDGINNTYNNFIEENLEDKIDEIKDKGAGVVEVFKSEPERKEECMNTFNQLNEIRERYDKSPISWDDNTYKLAVERSKDMYEKNYFDHVTPEGKCVDTMKQDYGFKSYEYLAENAGGMSYYSKGIVAGDCDEALNGWLESRGHRYNLLYEGHFA